VIEAAKPSVSSKSDLTQEEEAIPEDKCKKGPQIKSPESITVYGYPVEVFPPIDFHTATYFRNPTTQDEYIYIIGGLGYVGSTSREQTNVYRLHLSTFSMELLETSGMKPMGPTHQHTAVLVGDGDETQAAVSILTKDGKTFSLLLKTLEWASQAQDATDDSNFVTEYLESISTS
jgi:hypothetical protein